MRHSTCLWVSLKNVKHVRYRRATGGTDALKNHKNIGFISNNNGPDPLIDWMVCDLLL